MYLKSNNKKVFIAGDHYVGKTTVMEKLIKAFNCDVERVRIENYYSVYTIEYMDEKIDFIDLKGNSLFFMFVSKQVTSNANLLILVYDCNERKSLMRCVEYVNTIAGISIKYCPIILVGNQTDGKDKSLKANKLKNSLNLKETKNVEIKQYTYFNLKSLKTHTNLKQKVCAILKLKNPNGICLG